jgi:hypothetical protein
MSSRRRSDMQLAKRHRDPRTHLDDRGRRRNSAQPQHTIDESLAEEKQVLGLQSRGSKGLTGAEPIVTAGRPTRQDPSRRNAPTEPGVQLQMFGGETSIARGAVTRVASSGAAVARRAMARISVFCALMSSSFVPGRSGLALVTLAGAACLKTLLALQPDVFVPIFGTTEPGRAARWFARRHC